MLTNLFLGQTAEEKNFIEDLFSCYLYTGNGSTQTITNGIDLAGKGGMVWLKTRSADSSHAIFDTNRPVTQILSSNLTSITNNDAGYGLTSFNSNGFSLNATSYIGVNNSSSTYASWTFRKAPKFFDVVTYTGNGTAGRTISHSLGVAPGMIIIKQTNGTLGWKVYHRSTGNQAVLNLNLTDAAYTGLSTYWNSTTPTDTVFTLGNDASVNGNGDSYVAYLFAHDTTADGVIQCGSYTGNGSTSGPSISLGWEPQYVLIKNTTAATGWLVFDTMRGMPVGSAIDYYLFANTSDAEAGTQAYIDPTATGFNIVAGSGFINNASNTYIYLAIRRGPMRVPTDATKVFKAVARVGTGSATTVSSGFVTDFSIVKLRAGDSSAVVDRLRGSNVISTNLVNAETFQSTSFPISIFDVQDGFKISTGGKTNGLDAGYINYAFRRAPGFFDVACHTGTGSQATIPHNLGVSPELVINKARASTAYGTWNTWFPAIQGTSTAMRLDSTAIFSANGNLSSVSATSFTTGTGTGGINTSGGTFVTYLFASCPGVSKVGSYTGNGSSLNIDCGFTNGARFVLIKRTDATGDWFTFDTARGIVTANDPHLSLNTTAAEVTTNDSIDPLSTGFTVNQVAATNINVNAATYIYLAIA